MTDQQSAMTGPPAPSSRVCWPRPRYSLCFLFLAITACALGLAAWFRPYREEQFAYLRLTDGSPDVTRPYSRRIETWRRQWDGSRVRHGRSETYNAGETTPWLSQTFRMGKRHGPEVLVHGNLIYSFVCVNDENHGPATVRDPNGAMVYSTTWSRGKLQGEARHHLPNGTIRTYQFAHGRVTHCDGKPIASPLLLKLDLGEVDSRKVEQLTRVNRSLTNRFEQWETGRNISLPQIGWNGEVRAPWEAMELLGRVDIVDANAEQWHEPPFFPLGIEMASGLVLMARAMNCECDYRDGYVWVAPGIDDPDWRDPTGVAEIRPPLASSLSFALQTRVELDRNFRQRPLTDCLAEVTSGLDIKFDASRVEAMTRTTRSEPVGMDYKLPLRQALTKLLLHARCRCELRGETLVILPREPQAAH